jgi:hypothetical protein
LSNSWKGEGNGAGKEMVVGDPRRGSEVSCKTKQNKIKPHKNKNKNNKLIIIKIKIKIN